MTKTIRVRLRCGYCGGPLRPDKNCAAGCHDSRTIVVTTSRCRFSYYPAGAPGDSEAAREKRRAAARKGAQTKREARELLRRLEAAKRQERDDPFDPERVLRRMRAAHDEFMRKTIGEPLATLGLADWPVTKGTILAAFRQRAKDAHPDRGGSAVEFRSLVEARDYLLGLVP